MTLSAQFFVVNSHGTYVDWSMRSLPMIDTLEFSAIPADVTVQRHHVFLLGHLTDYVQRHDALSGTYGFGPILLQPTSTTDCVLHFADAHMHLPPLCDESAPVLVAAALGGGTLPPAVAHSGHAAHVAPSGNFAATSPAAVCHLHFPGHLADYDQQVEQTSGIYTLERLRGLPFRHEEMVRLAVTGGAHQLHFEDGTISFASVLAAREQSGTYPRLSESMFADSVPILTWRRPAPPATDDRLAETSRSGFLAHQASRLGSYPLMAIPPR